jgi:hypothetical protein
VLACQASNAQQVSQQMSMGQNQSVMASILSPVAGEPYQADEVTRSVQKLGDGTTITREWSGLIARDGEGRIREDMYMVHAVQLNGRQVNRSLQSATIGDPVSHSMLIWTDERLRIAMRMQLPSLAGLRTAHTTGDSPMVRMLKEDSPPPPRGTPPVILGNKSGLANNVMTEDLGQQSVEGVLATGKRITTTIPTGEIGNDRPIVTVHEEWRSPELKILVKSMDSDPRTGVQTMELHNLVRSEPDAALFQPPAGFKIQDMGDMLKALGSIGRVPPPPSAPASPN